MVVGAGTKVVLDANLVNNSNLQVWQAPKACGVIKRSLA